MSEMPNRVSPGDRLSAHWLNRLLDYLRSITLRPGPGVRITRTPSGTTISAEHAETEPLTSIECCPAVVHGSGGVPGTYVATIYPRGIGGSVSETVLLAATERGVELDLPSGTVVLAHAIVLSAAEDGAAESEEEGEE